jgi:hypothetical protein
MHPNGISQRPPESRARRRHLNPRDADHARAAELFGRLLAARHRGAVPHARHLLHAINALGFRVEPLDPGYRLVPDRRPS